MKKYRMLLLLPVPIFAETPDKMPFDVKADSAYLTDLGMNNTHFENATGLDDDTVKHLTSARDIALMSRELLTHSTITKYSTIWMDTIRDGAFGLTSTNRLIRFYQGATGLKTGSTSKAGFCMSATAEREGLHLIAVVMGADTRDQRNETAKQLLDYGFANYSLYSRAGSERRADRNGAIPQRRGGSGGGGNHGGGRRGKDRLFRTSGAPSRHLLPEMRNFRIN